jgi:hypothetical protein
MIPIKQETNANFVVEWDFGGDKNFVKNTFLLLLRIQRAERTS